MAVEHNCSKGWLATKAFKSALIVLATALVVLIMLSSVGWLAVSTGSVGGLLITAIGFIYAFRETKAMTKFVYKFCRTFQIGWWGEYIVGNVLKQLSDDTHVFYDFKPIDRHENIDFIVVNRSGVFALEVKYHSNKKFFSRWFYKEKKQTLNESRYLHALLVEQGIDIKWVHGVLVRADQRTVPKSTYGQLDMVGIDEIEKYFESKEEGVFDEPTLKRVVDILHNKGGCKI